jgi:CRP-like cAMP-binding protein
MPDRCISRAPLLPSFPKKRLQQRHPLVTSFIEERNPSFVELKDSIVSQAARSPIYWSFSGPDSWRLSVQEVSSAFVADPELIRELEQLAEPIALGSDRILFRQGDVPKGVFIIRKGTAKLTSRSDGDAVLCVQAGIGSLLGVPAVVGAKPYSLSAEALDGAEMSLLKSEDFIHLMKTEPSLSFRVLQILAEEVRFGREALSHL